MPSGPLPINRVPSPELLRAWSQAQQYANSLFAALDALDECGGSAKLAASQGWSVDALDKALGTLMAAREGLDLEIGRLEQRRKFYPRRRRIG